jgi:hypothetical protein
MLPTNPTNLKFRTGLFRKLSEVGNQQEINAVKLLERFSCFRDADLVEAAHNLQRKLVRKIAAESEGKQQSSARSG